MPRGPFLVLNLALCLACAALAPGAWARPADDAPLGRTLSSWQRAPLYGADIRSLAVDPQDPDRLYAGSSAGHLYVSRDGGESWRSAAPYLPFPGWVVSALQFDPNRPQRLWAGLWGVWGGGMVAYSEDGGASWEYRTEGIPDSQIYSLALVPGEPGRLYVGTRRGVFGSRDDGLTWRRLTAALPRLQKVTSLLVDAEDPRRIYAGTWRRAYLSEDGGETWRGIFEGMVLDSEVFALEPAAGRAGEIWASTCGWVYRSRDRGESWTRFKEGLHTRRTPSFRSLVGGRLLAGTVGGLYRSDDEGRSWQRATSEELAVHAIAFDPRRPRRVVLGTEGSGIWLSRDGADSFRRIEPGMSNLWVTGLVRVGDELLAAVSHGGPASGIYSSADGGASFQLQLAAVPTVLALATDGRRVWAGTEQGLYERGADLGWRRVQEVPAARVEALRVDSEGVHAALAGRAWREEKGRFAPLREPQPEEVSASGSRWTAVEGGLERRSGGEAERVAAPAQPRQLLGVESSLLLSGESETTRGVWLRHADGLWSPILKAPARLLSADGSAYALLISDEDELFLFDGRLGRLHRVDLDVPPRAVDSATVHGDRLFVGTRGYGLLTTDLSRFGAREGVGAAPARGPD